MKKCKICNLTKSYDFFYKSKTCSDGYLHLCKECRNKKIRDKYHKNHEESRAAKNTYYWKNREREKAARRMHYKRHKSAYLSRFYTREKHIKLATPSWLTKQMKEELETIYKFRMVLSEASGHVYHVDHIVPLRGKKVCGLHVPWNLQIISAEDNLTKGNKYE